MQTFNIAPHGNMEIITEHRREWLVCPNCGAQWALHGADTEQITDGDGWCDDHANDQQEQGQ